MKTCILSDSLSITPFHSYQSRWVDSKTRSSEFIQPASHLPRSFQMQMLTCIPSTTSDLSLISSTSHIMTPASSDWPLFRIAYTFKTGRTQPRRMRTVLHEVYATGSVSTSRGQALFPSVSVLLYYQLSHTWPSIADSERQGRPEPQTQHIRTCLCDQPSHNATYSQSRSLISSPTASKKAGTDNDRVQHPVKMQDVILAGVCHFLPDFFTTFFDNHVLSR